jgi:hypothetical protein
MRGLRAALLEIFELIGADPARSPQLAENLGISKSLAWRASKIALATNVIGAVRYVPRRNGFETLLRAVEASGLASERTARAREVYAEFEAMVRVHAGDRATLDLLVETLLPAGDRAEILERNRKLAFQGNSGTLGVQAETQFCTHIVAPGSEEGSCDLINLAGLTRFRRLREVRWPILRRALWHRGGEFTEMPRERPLDPAGDAGGTFLLEEFSTSPLPELREAERNAAVQYDLPAGPVGIAAALDFALGSVVENAGPTSVTDDDETCELGCRVLTPVEVLEFRVLVHEDLGWSPPDTPQLLSFMGSEQPETIRRPEGLELELVERAREVRPLGPGPSGSRYERHDELLGWALETADLPAEAFREYRLDMNFPLVPSGLYLTFGLAGRSAGPRP